MSRSSKILFVLVAAGLLPVTAAQAQYSSPPPLYPYDARSIQPYAVQVAPNTYVIQRPAEQPRNYPYVRGTRSGGTAVAAPKPGRFDRPHKPVDHKLIDELRKRHSKNQQARSEQADTEPTIHRPGGRSVINTTRIVRDAPVVRETRRYVDLPPRIIERHQVVDDDTGAVETEQRPNRGDTKKRVIAADAEVTILGPDRMSIRLFRKGQGPRAQARAE